MAGSAHHEADGGLDPLSRLLPKASFVRRLEAEAARAQAGGEALSLLVVDIDFFKNVNDAFGHARGDEVLEEFAARLLAMIRRADIAVRYGGDEFVVILPGTDKPEALGIAQRILDTIHTHPFAGDPPLSLSLSIGVATLPEDAASAAELFERADAHTYEAKRRGRGQVVGEFEESAPTDPRLQPLSRVIERDAQLDAVHEFLASLPTVRRGGFSLHGPAGAGRTRLLAEVDTAAQMLGYQVLRLRGTPALRGRMYGALVEAHPDLEGAIRAGVATVAAVLADRLHQQGRSVLVVTVDDFPHLDEASRTFLKQLVSDPQLGSVGVVCTTEWPLAEFGFSFGITPAREVGLTPLSRSGVRSWLRAALQWDPPGEFLEWLHRETGGVPARVHRGLARLLDLSLLARDGSTWALDPTYCQFSLGAWLDSVARPAPGTLPPLSSSIIGRDGEVRELKALLRSERLITLTGPGGFGKTRLAAQVAAELAEELAHEVCFVPLAPLSAPEYLIPAVAEALRISLHASREPKQQLLGKLRERQVLLVLDNFEHLVAAAPLVAEILACAPTARLLVTSRERLGVRGEAVYPIGGISLPAEDDVESVGRSPATQMFVQQAERHNLDFRLTCENAPTVAAICRALEGAPLAIEIAASLVRLLRCDEILAEVRRDLDTLASAARDLPERHQSLRAVFDYSWQLLSPAEQEVWARLSVFHGGFAREAAERVAGATLPMLVVLANKSLLHRTEDGRFEVHETLRRYALEKLRGTPEEWEATQTRYVRHFAAFVYERGERGPRIDVVRMKRETAHEIENIRAGFRVSVERGEFAEAERYIKGLFRFYDVYGWFSEGEEMFRWAAADVPDLRLQALIVARRAYFLVKLGEYEEARRLHQRSLRALRRTGDTDEGALSLFSLAHIAMQQGDYERGDRLCRNALRIFRRTGSDFGRAMCLNELGIVALMRADHEAADRRFRRSLAIRREIGDLPGQARCLNNLAMSADMQGRSREARTLFEQSLAASRQSGDPHGVANALNNLGVLIRHAALAEGSAQLFREARHFLEEALEVYGEIGVDSGVALTHFNLGDIAFHLEEDRAAEEHFREALRRFAANDSIPMLCCVFIGVAALLARRGDDRGAAHLLILADRHPATLADDRKRAAELLGEVARRLPADDLAALRASADGDALRDVALRLVRSQGPDDDPPHGPRSPGGLPFTEDVATTIEEGQQAERNARYAAARLCYETALYSLRTTEQARLAAQLLRWVGRTYVAEGDLGAADDCLEASLAVAQAHGRPADIVHAINLQGIVQFYRGDIDEAGRVYARARETAERAGDLELLATVDQNLGVLANTRGDLQAALDHYQAALQSFRALGHDERTTAALNNLGMLYTDLQMWPEAEAAFGEALRQCERSDDLETRAMVEVNLVELRIEQQDFEAARLACDSAFELATQAGHMRALGELHKHYGVIYLNTAHLYLAEAHLSQAARIALEHDNLLLTAETAREQAELYWRLERNRETLQSLNRAHQAFLRLRARRDLAATDRRIDEFESRFLNIVRQWGESIESADQYTQGHCERVADLACMLARAAGMDEKTLLWFRMGALLHDVGKIVVPLEVLNKPGRLTPEEREIIERHPDAGVEMLSEIEFPWDIRPMVRHHHEKWEGGGYPCGLVGEEIPLSARILCIADVYDALTSDRPYRAGFSHEKAIEIMQTGMQGHFDPELFEAFERISTQVLADDTADAALTRAA